MIPEDLLTEILLRIPVKILLRCKSVCKPWLSLISSPNFINSHIRRAVTRPGADETLIVYRTDDHMMSLFHVDSCEYGAPLGFPFSRGDICFDPEFKIIGSYNGVVCVSVCNCPRYRYSDFDWYTKYDDEIRNPNIYLWNPATKQSKLIPSPNSLDDASMGFGFDPAVGNGFKVVRVVSPSDKTVYAEVYSANTNAWRKVEPDLTDYPDYADFDVCVNGFLCCMGFYGIMAFDLNTEVFTCGIWSPAGSNYCMTDFNDCIAVLTSKGNECNHLYDLWTLNDEACLRGGGGGEASWTLMLSIDVDLSHPYVYGYFNNGDLLLKTDDQVFLLYNSDNKETRNVPGSIYMRRRFNKYNESLVSITGSKQVNWNAYEDDS